MQPPKVQHEPIFKVGPLNYHDVRGVFTYQVVWVISSID